MRYLRSLCIKEPIKIQPAYVNIRRSRYYDDAYSMTRFNTRHDADANLHGDDVLYRIVIKMKETKT